MDPLRLHPVASGACIGAAAGGLGAAEILAGNRPTLNPGSGTFLAALWILAGAALGALVARAFRGRSGAAAPSLAAVAGGGFFLPALPAAVFSAGLPLLLLARRRWLTRTPRVDPLVVAVVTVASGVLLFARTDVAALLRRAPEPPPAAAAGTLPYDALPVALSVRDGGEYPDVPAVHVALRELASERPGRVAAVWSGRAPARTRVGPSIPRLLPGGGGVSRFPGGASRLLLAPFPRGDRDTPPFAGRGILLDRAAAAGIPVLEGPLRDGDPPLWLRVLEGADVDRALAEELRGRCAWIDVRLEGEGGRVALTGRGVRLEPSAESIAAMDVAPTVLHLLGLPVPRASDGRVLLELLDPEGAGSRPIRYSPRKVPGVRRRRTASTKRGSLRTGSNLGSARKRSGDVRPASSERPSQ